jgi:hypothetical protein
MGRPTKYNLCQFVRTVAEIKVQNPNISTNVAVQNALNHYNKLSDRSPTKPESAQLIASVKKEYSKTGPTLESEIKSEKARGRWPPWPVMPTLLGVQQPKDGPRRQLASDFRELLNDLSVLANRLEREDDPRLVSDVHTIIAAIRSAPAKRDKQKARVAKTKEKLR